MSNTVLAELQFLLGKAQEIKRNYSETLSSIVNDAGTIGKDDPNASEKFNFAESRFNSASKNVITQMNEVLEEFNTKKKEASLLDIFKVREYTKTLNDIRGETVGLTTATKPELDEIKVNLEFKPPPVETKPQATTGETTQQSKPKTLSDDGGTAKNPTAITGRANESYGGIW